MKKKLLYIGGIILLIVLVIVFISILTNSFNWRILHPNTDPEMERIYGLSEQTDQESLNALIEYTNNYEREDLRVAAIQALGKRNEVEAENVLFVIATNYDDEGNALATSFLGKHKNETIKEALLEIVLSEDSTEEHKNAAAYSLRHYNDNETVNFLIDFASTQNVSDRVLATIIYSLGVTGDKRAIPLIKEGLQGEIREVKYNSALVSQRVWDSEINELLVNSLIDYSEFPHVRKAAASALALNADSDNLNSLREGISNTDGFGIVLISEVFGAKKYTEGYEDLINWISKTEDTYVIQRVNENLQIQ